MEKADLESLLLSLAEALYRTRGALLVALAHREVGAGMEVVARVAADLEPVIRASLAVVDYLQVRTDHGK